MLLNNRFEVIRPLAEGSAGITLLATDKQSNNLVVIKRFKHLVSNRNQLQKEIQLLREIRHPRIPRFLDAFEARADFVTRWHLVQEYVDGEDLQQEISSRRYTVPDILEILDSVLELIVFLHSLSPPLIHRDIKPGNLIRRKSDGAIFLVDFGSASELSRGDLGHTINTGTLGYQAPEQIRGEAQFASDLYSIGVLAIALCSNTSPRKLLKGMTLDWKPAVSHLSPEFTAWLDKMLAEDPKQRYASAQQAKTVLKSLTAVPTKTAPPPSKSLDLAKRESQLSQRNDADKQTKPIKKDIEVAILSSRISTHLILSVISFFFCSLLSVIPIVLSLQAKTALQQEEYDVVRHKLQMVKYCFIGFAVIIFLFFGLYFLFFIAAVAIGI